MSALSQVERDENESSKKCIVLDEESIMSVRSSPQVEKDEDEKKERKKGTEKGKKPVPARKDTCKYPHPVASSGLATIPAASAVER
jgi:hypothetical protein